MKRKRAKQKHKLTQWALLLIAVFFVGVILWINWSHIQELIRPEPKSTPSRRAPRPSQEEIMEKERKNLDNILKRR